jgi:hypothetical protein
MFVEADIAAGQPYGSFSAGCKHALLNQRLNLSPLKQSNSLVEGLKICQMADIIRIEWNESNSREQYCLRAVAFPSSNPPYFGGTCSVDLTVVVYLAGFLDWSTRSLPADLAGHLQECG